MTGCSPSPKYLVSAGKVDHAVWPVPAGISSFQSKLTPHSVAGSPRCSMYQAERRLGSLERRKTPPIPVARAMESSFARCEMRDTRTSLREGGVGGAAGRGGFAAEERGGDQGDEQADGEGLHKGVGHVDEGVLILLCLALDFGDLRGGGGRVQARGLDFVDCGGPVAIHDVGHEVEVENLPHDDVANAGDEGDEDA